MSDKKGDVFSKLTGEIKVDTLSHECKEDEDEEAIMEVDGR